MLLPCAKVAPCRCCCCGCCLSPRSKPADDADDDDNNDDVNTFLLVAKDQRKIERRFIKMRIDAGLKSRCCCLARSHRRRRRKSLRIMIAVFLSYCKPSQAKPSSRAKASQANSLAKPGSYSTGTSNDTDTGLVTCPGPGLRLRLQLPRPGTVFTFAPALLNCEHTNSLSVDIRTNLNNSPRVG